MSFFHRVGHFFLCLTAMSLAASSALAQQNYEIACVGFYNLENLFDTEDDPNIWDEEFTPSGSKAWSTERYRDKLKNMADVISQLGTQFTSKGVLLLGVAEVENRRVLEDLVKVPSLANRQYGIVHYDSPDRRGIDVGLLYQKESFAPDTSFVLPLEIFESDSSRIYTRDVLVVQGELEGDPMHIMVNHWPSRRGGEARSAPLRAAAAKLCRDYIDSTLESDPDAKIILMGDLNDDPTSKSLKKVLKTKKSKKDLKRNTDLYNTVYSLYQKGVGSNAYRDNWSLFDQIIINKNLAERRENGFFHYKTAIFNDDFLIQKTGRYKGYPFRSFAGGSYMGGYSDHFPALIYLIKEVH